MNMQVIETDSPVAGPDVGTAADLASRQLPREGQSTWTWPVDPTEQPAGPDTLAHDSLAGTLLLALAWGNQNF